LPHGGDKQYMVMHRKAWAWTEWHDGLHGHPMSAPVWHAADTLGSLPERMKDKVARRSQRAGRIVQDHRYSRPVFGRKGHPRHGLRAFHCFRIFHQRPSLAPSGPLERDVFDTVPFPLCAYFQHTRGRFNNGRARGGKCSRYGGYGEERVSIEARAFPTARPLLVMSWTCFSIRYIAPMATVTSPSVSQQECIKSLTFLPVCPSFDAWKHGLRQVHTHVSRPFYAIFDCVHCRA
jgi:hypothetical protein